MENKIICWISGDLNHYCISHALQKKLDCTLYSIIDVTNKQKSFFIDEPIVNFEKKWFYNDHIKISDNIDFDYLKNFENKYDIDLWKLAVNERMFYRFFDLHKFTRNEILSILESSCKLFESVLDEIKPNFLLTKWPSRHHHELFIELCLAKDIKVLMLSQPNIAKRHMISQNPNQPDSQIILNEIHGENRDFIELQNYFNSVETSKSLKKINYKKTKISNSLKAYSEYLFSKNDNPQNQYYYFGRSKLRVITNELKNYFKIKYRTKFMNDNLVKKINLLTPFAYFPLSVDMERTLLINAPFFTNQIEIIRHIVKSLPTNFHLYLKENPSQVSRLWRSKQEYEEIMNIPNVTLLHPSFPQKILFEKCALVFSIAGTSGLEAAFYKKPSIVFSDPIYSILPSVSRVKCIEDLPKIIHDTLKKKVNSSDLDKFLVGLEKSTFSFDRLSFHDALSKTFFYDGKLTDAHISNSKMKSFLDINSQILDELAVEHIKKINWHKENEKNTNSK